MSITLTILHFVNLYDFQVSIDYRVIQICLWFQFVKIIMIQWSYL